MNNAGEQLRSIGNVPGVPVAYREHSFFSFLHRMCRYQPRGSLACLHNPYRSHHRSPPIRHLQRAINTIAFTVPCFHTFCGLILLRVDSHCFRENLPLRASEPETTEEIRFRFPIRMRATQKVACYLVPIYSSFLGIGKPHADNCTVPPVVRQDTVPEFFADLWRVCTFRWKSRRADEGVRHQFGWQHLIARQSATNDSRSIITSTAPYDIPSRNATVIVVLPGRRSEIHSKINGSLYTPATKAIAQIRHPRTHRGLSKPPPPEAWFSEESMFAGFF